MIDRDIRIFILKALLAAEGAPLTDGVLKSAIRAAFPGAAFAEADLVQQIRACETAGWVSGSQDELIGLSWGLTVKGKMKAQQL